MTQKLSAFPENRSVLRLRNTFGDFWHVTVNGAPSVAFKQWFIPGSTAYAALPLTCTTSGPGVCPR